MRGVQVRFSSINNIEPCVTPDRNREKEDSLVDCVEV